MREIPHSLTAVSLLAGMVLSASAVAQPAPQGTWTLKTPRLDITNEAAAVAIGGKLLAGGGGVTDQLIMFTLP